VEFSTVETEEPTSSAEDRYRIAAGAVFQTLREQQGWSLREFGERAGAAHTSLYAVEKGESTPGIEVLDRVASAFGMDLQALLSLIIDRLNVLQPAPSDSLPELILTFQRLPAELRREVLKYIDYLEYRSRETRTD
jgi:transcriptional regulator with XRE-family HTH domain